jgi:hypothetical protein
MKFSTDWMLHLEMSNIEIFVIILAVELKGANCVTNC